MQVKMGEKLSALHNVDKSAVAPSIMQIIKFQLELNCIIQKAVIVIIN